MTAPTISSVSGTIETGQSLTVTGSNLIHEDTTGYDASLLSGAGSFEGANPAADNWDAGNYTYDSVKKLYGAQSIKVQDVGVGSGPFDDHIHGLWPLAFSNALAKWVGFYFNVDNQSSDGSYPTVFHKLVLAYADDPNPLNFNINVAGNGGPYPGLYLYIGDTGDTGAWPDGAFRNGKWYHAALFFGTPYIVKLNGTQLFTVNAGTAGLTNKRSDLQFHYNLGPTNANYDATVRFDQLIASDTEVRPLSVYEITDDPNYATASPKVYQYPETLADGSAVINCDLTGLGAGQKYLFVTNNRNERVASPYMLGAVQDSGEIVLSI